MPTTIPDDCFGRRHNSRAVECRICFGWDKQQKAECRRLSAVRYAEWKSARQKKDLKSKSPTLTRPILPPFQEGNTGPRAVIEAIERMPEEFVIGGELDRVVEEVRRERGMPAIVKLHTIRRTLSHLVLAGVLGKTRGGYIRVKPLGGRHAI